MIADTPATAAPFHIRRMEAVRRKAEKEGLEALLVTSLQNVRYLTGFSGTAGTVLVTMDGAFFLTDFRYTTQATLEVHSAKVVESKELLASVQSILVEKKIKKLGFESEKVTYYRAGEMKQKFAGVELLPVKDMVESVRIIKDEPEMEAFKWLIGILADTFGDALSLIKPGARERDIAVELEYLLRKRGADGPAFDFIVASGPRSAMPHGVASSKTVAAGELVTLDWGAKGRGYHSDNTRTVSVGKVDKELEKIYNLVLEANLAGIQAVKPGVTVKQVDDAARKLITDAGYGEAFGHGTGHGVGLDIHEKPAVSWRDETVVEEGMVFTIEPGIYLPGKGGVRIEDMVAVTKTGCEVLSDSLPKTFMVI